MSKRGRAEGSPHRESSTSPGDEEEAVGLAEWAAGLLALTDQTEEGRLDPTELVPIKLTAQRRSLLLRQPAIARELKTALEVSGGTRTVKLTVQQWCDICFALAEAILKAGGREHSSLSTLAQRIGDALHQFVRDRLHTSLRPLSMPKRA